MKKGKDMTCSCNRDKQTRDLIRTIKEIRYNGPATIIFWNDGAKTVVKCENETVNDPVVGFLMAVNKKLLPSRTYTAICDKLVDIYDAKSQMEEPLKTLFDMDHPLELDFNVDEECLKKLGFQFLDLK